MGRLDLRFGGPDLHGQLVVLVHGVQLDLLGQFQICPLNDFAHFLVGKTEPPVMLFLAQGFQLVRSKIHDQQAPARPQDPATLSHRQGRVVEIVQNLVHSHQIRRPLFER